MMNLSFQEKSIWVSLVATLLTFGIYFANAFRLLAEPDTPPAVLIPIFLGAVVMFIIIEVVLHIILAAASHREAAAGIDERDHLIELKATRISYFVLAAGAWITGTAVLMSASPLILANSILFSFILAEIVRFSTQLFYYRRGL